MGRGREINIGNTQVFRYIVLSRSATVRTNLSDWVYKRIIPRFRAFVNSLGANGYQILPIIARI